MSAPTLHSRTLLLAALTLFSLGVVKAVSQENAPAAPDTPEAHLGKGYDDLKQDRYDAAVAEFRAALAKKTGTGRLSLSW